MAIFKLFKIYWRISQPEQWRVIFYLFWHMVSIAGALCKPYAFAMALNHLQQGRLQAAWQWLAVYVVGFAVFEAGHRIARSTELYVAFRNRKRFMLSAYDRLQALPLAWHHDHHSANVIDRVNKAADAVLHFGESQSKYIEVIVNLAGSLIFLWMLSPLIAIIGCATGLLTVWVTQWIYGKSVPEYRMQNELYHKLAAALMDYVSHITTIITLRLGKRARADLESRNEAVFPHLVKEHRLTQVKCFLNALMMAALNVSMIVFYIQSQSSAGSMVMLGSVAAVFQYLDLLMSAFGFYGGDYENILHWWQDYQAAALLFHPESMPHPLTDEASIPDDWERIQIGAFDFHYGQGRAELHCDAIQLERGKHIAFVGESGSGKSTCLHILQGLLHADGAAAVDDVPYPISALGRIATLVGQESEIFENTVLHNITLGLSASASEVDSAAYIACFDEVASKLSRGYETDIREDGVNLSGGEKQRLALARGVFAMTDSSLILLDEPTGSLDAVTEAKVYQRLMNAFPHACIVSTLHRLHLLEWFDYVYVFKDCHIAEEGRFQDLIMRDGVLSQLWRQYQMADHSQ